MTRDYLLVAVAPTLCRLVLDLVALLKCHRKDVPAIVKRWRQP